MTFKPQDKNFKNFELVNGLVGLGDSFVELGLGSLHGLNFCPLQRLFILDLIEVFIAFYSFSCFSVIRG